MNESHRNGLPVKLNNRYAVVPKYTIGELDLFFIIVYRIIIDFIVLTLERTDYGLLNQVWGTLSKRQKKHAVLNHGSHACPVCCHVPKHDQQKTRNVISRCTEETVN